jgi:hypothetical protein
MATFTPKKLAFVQLANAKADIYDPPASTMGEVHNIILHNSHTSTEVVVINLHDGTNEYQLYKISLLTLETVQLSFGSEGLIVDSASKITGNTTTAAKVTCMINGTERV